MYCHLKSVVLIDFNSHMKQEQLQQMEIANTTNTVPGNSSIDGRGIIETGSFLALAMSHLVIGS